MKRFMAVFMVFSLLFCSLAAFASAEECQVDMRLFCNGKEVNPGDVLEVHQGDVIIATAYAEAGIDRIGYYYICDGEKKEIVDIYEDTIFIEIPEGDSSNKVYLYIEAIAKNDDGSANTVTKTGWWEIELKYQERIEKVPVEVTVKDINGNVINPEEKHQFKAGDVLLVTASCMDEKAVYWSQNVEFMESKNFLHNDKGMAILGYVWDGEDAEEFTDSLNPTVVAITIPDFEVGTEHYVEIQGVSAVDNYVSEGVQYISHSEWVCIEFEVIE